MDRKLVIDAFMYVQPLVETRRQMYANQATMGPINKMSAFRKLLDASYRNVPSVNCDTIYTALFYDLSEEAMVLDMPKIDEGRFCVYAFYDAFTNVYTCFGTSNGETDGGIIVLKGPHGAVREIPEGATVVESPTDFGLVASRYLVVDDEDLPAAQSLQDKFTATFLKDYLKGKRSKSVDVLDHPEPLESPRPDVEEDIVAFWNLAAETIVGTPIPPRDKRLFDSFRSIGLTETGFTFPDDPQERESLIDGTKAGWEELRLLATDPKKAQELGVNFIKSNGWSWQAIDSEEEYTWTKDYGTDYLIRAWVNYRFYGMLPPQEALYPTSYIDHNGEQLNGENTYQFTVSATNIPNETSGFWSVTLYDLDGFFYDNDIRRYKICNRDTWVTIEPHGDIVITVSKDKPEDPRANWLPAPSKEFYLFFRSYIPKKDLISGTYEFNPILRIG